MSPPQFHLTTCLAVFLSPPLPQVSRPCPRGLCLLRSVRVHACIRMAKQQHVSRPTLFATGNERPLGTHHIAVYRGFHLNKIIKHNCFTHLSRPSDARCLSQVMAYLNALFTLFDELIDQYEVGQRATGRTLGEAGRSQRPRYTCCKWCFTRVSHSDPLPHQQIHREIQIHGSTSADSHTDPGPRIQTHLIHCMMIAPMDRCTRLRRPGIATSSPGL